MARLLFTAIVACTLIALSSARRFRNIFDHYGVLPNHIGTPLDASQYFFNFLSPYFPNEKFPNARLVQAEYVGVDTDGGPTTPIRFTVNVHLQDSLQLHTCTLIVQLGNQVTGHLYSLYYDETLKGCSS